MRDRVSVAMVTFNGADYLREQLESILTQNPLPDQLVIGDDGSTDGSIDLVRDITRDSAVPVVVLGGDHVGLRLNVQRTVEACAGEIIALADQDDVWMPGKVAAIREAFQDPSVTLWFSDADLIDDAGRMIGERLWERVKLSPAQQAELLSEKALRRLLVGQAVTGATMAFGASLKELILPLPPQLEVDGHLFLHDGWIAVLAWLMGEFAIDPVPWIRYRRHSRQVTASLERPEEHPSGETTASKWNLRGTLTSAEELHREHARADLVLNRLRESGRLEACRPEDVKTLVELEMFLAARTSPRGASRVRTIFYQLALGRYAQYARGWRTAAADVLLPRD